MSVLNFIPYFQKRKYNKQVRDFKKSYVNERSFNQDGLEINASHIELSNKFCKSYYLNKAGKHIGYHDINKFFNLHNEKFSNIDFEYSIKIIFKDYNSLMLFRQSDMTKKNIEGDTTLPFFGGSKAVARKDIEVIEEIEDKVADGDQMLDFCFLLTVYTDTLEKLKDVDQVLQTKLQLGKWEFFTPYGSQKEAFDTSLPIPATNNAHYIKMLSSEASRFVIPTSTNKAGILPFGLDLIKKNIYRFNLLEDNRVPTITVTGINGSGKSAFCKKYFEESAIIGMQRFYFDAEGECKNLAEATYSEIIKVNSNSKGVNIVYFDEETQNLLKEEEFESLNVLDVHINWLISVLFMFKCWDPTIREVRTDLNNILLEFYQSTVKKAGEENYNISEVRNMRTLYLFVKSKTKELESIPKPKEDEKAYLISLKLIEKGLSNFYTGLYKHYFSSEKDFILDYDSIIFDLSGNEDEHLRKVFAYILLYKTFQKMLTADRGRIVFIDELHMFLKLEGFADLLIQYLKRCRKYNGSFVLITQELDELAPYPALLKEMSYHFIFNQQDIKTDIVKLRKSDIDDISSLKIGTCLILNNRDHTTSKVKILLKEHQIQFSKAKAKLDAKMNTFSRYFENEEIKAID